MRRTVSQQRRICDLREWLDWGREKLHANILTFTPTRYPMAVDIDDLEIRGYAR